MIMEFAEARRIPLEKLVEILGGIYSHTDGHGDLWYFSPFRANEETASFKINVKLNKWKDFGHSQTVTHPHLRKNSGGDILDLWCDFKFKDRRDAIKEALQAMKDLGLLAANHEEQLKQRQQREQSAAKKKDPAFKILKISERITYRGLKEELQRRRISLELANLYLKQGYILNTVTQKQYCAFLFPNDKGGYEVSIPNTKRGECFKTSIGGKGSTYIKPSKESYTAEVYEGFWDALSWLEFKEIKQPVHHIWCLNSNSFANEVVEKIIKCEQKIDCVLLFLDNDLSGRNTTYAMASALEESNKVVGGMEGNYEGYKDMSAHWSCK
jgi:hypothetical protein